MVVRIVLLSLAFFLSFHVVNPSDDFFNDCPCSISKDDQFVQILREVVERCSLSELSNLVRLQKNIDSLEGESTFNLPFWYVDFMASQMLYCLLEEKCRVPLCDIRIFAARIKKAVKDVQVSIKLYNSVRYNVETLSLENSHGFADLVKFPHDVEVGGSFCVTGTTALKDDVHIDGDVVAENIIIDDHHQIRLKELAVHGENYTALQSPLSLDSDYALTLPVNAGGANYVMVSDGSGVLSWVPLVQITGYKAGAYIGEDQTLASTGVAEALAFDAILYDPNSNFDTNTYSYTVPVSGYYFVSVNIMDDASSDEDRYVSLLVDGSSKVGYGAYWRKPDITTSFSTVIFLSAGQVLSAEIEGRKKDKVLAQYSTFFIHIISV